MAESFFKTLKVELGGRFRTRQEAYQQLFDYIERFYNTQRLHSSLGYRSPAEYERLMAAQTASRSGPRRLRRGDGDDPLRGSTPSQRQHRGDGSYTMKTVHEIGAGPVLYRLTSGSGRAYGPSSTPSSTTTPEPTRPGQEARRTTHGGVVNLDRR